ncbi:XRE family transcriptional regulator [Pseudomonas sp. 910_21]|uniref:XRE family transcriptional regulator n=1 Tax=Pseudomonas sp. 910_21 TaxID=2604460 RepID=UPI0040629FB1
MKTIGERIAQKREAAGLNQSELGRRMGVTPQAVQKWEAGISTPRNSKLGELATILGTSKVFLIDGTPMPTDQPVEDLGPIDAWDEESPLRDDEVAVPFLREIELAAGTGRFAIQQDEGETLRFSKKKLRENNVQFSNARCVTVRGNSMAPVLRDGATVGVDVGKTSISDIIDGDLYAISQNGQLRVKQLYRQPSGVRLRSFNRDEHQDEDYSFEEMHDEQIMILGRVFWWAMYAR